MPESGTSGSAGGPGPATAQVYPPDAPLGACGHSACRLDAASGEPVWEAVAERRGVPRTGLAIGTSGRRILPATIACVG